ncbi:oligopeptide transporter, OPT family [Helicobacter monodelphidis]|uniref:OPT family oligopeptide transporter n=1 Tax=Helicobacter sp. 15-1451 TaxID=2004995 RepID=UPI000DCC3B9B|nr:oligopeptide transporter, OPT family [Helicobacter sp. 15-1451]RAX57614.1 oligopeptide transporter, OPT family [Helicobacter sp. 15-1451]
MNQLPELTLRGMILGGIITLIFTASNVYLGLKVGLTFSSAIPAAVISMAVLRFFKNSNILENNLVQTQASAAGTLSAVIFVLPSILMMGYWQNFEFWQTFILCACGGCLGILFTIPLRRAMVVNSPLPYPEGVAAAEILKVGSATTSNTKNAMREILLGSGIASLLTLCTNGFRLFSMEANFWFSAGGMVTQIPMGFSTALLAAGYLIGIASGIAMLIGSFIAWGILVPYYTSLVPVHGDIGAIAETIWSQKVRFIGVGMIGIAAIWTLITLLKSIFDGISVSIQSIKNKKAGIAVNRKDTDLSPFAISLLTCFIIFGLGVVFYSFISNTLDGYLLWIYIIVGVCVSVGMGFFVAAACGYMAGLIGSSSSPISGVGILGVIISSLIVLALGLSFHLLDSTEGVSFATALALFMTTVIVSIACIANDNLQDLKTGFLVGATPYRQQIALVLGCIAGALVIAPVLNLLYEAYGFTGMMPREGMAESQALSAPQATLMTHIAQGIFSSTLEWNYIVWGIGLGVSVILVDIVLKKKTSFSLPPLAVGMGIYLPPTLQTPLVIGSIMGFFILKSLHKHYSAEEIKKRQNKGILLASGLIVGESLMGVLIAGIIVVSISAGGGDSPLAIIEHSPFGDIIGLICFMAVIAFFIQRMLRTKH